MKNLGKFQCSVKKMNYASSVGARAIYHTLNSYKFKFNVVHHIHRMYNVYSIQIYNTIEYKRYLRTVNRDKWTEFTKVNAVNCLLEGLCPSNKLDHHNAGSRPLNMMDSIKLHNLANS